MPGRLGNALAVMIGGAGGLLTLNTALSQRAGDLEPPLEGDQHAYRFRGLTVEYTELGDPADQSLLLLHELNLVGSSREYAGVADALAEYYHVIAPDFPGYGRSDRPPINYEAGFYTDFIQAFVPDIVPEAVCVAPSLPAVLATMAHRERPIFSHLILICPTATTMPTRRSWRRALIRTPGLGTTAFNLLVSKPSIRYVNATTTYYDPSHIDDDIVTYQWRTSHQPGAKYAPASFLAGHLDPTIRLNQTIASIDSPVTLIWGREAEHTPLSVGRYLADAGNAKLIVFDRARRHPHIEYPTRFVAVLRDELDGIEH